MKPTNNCLISSSATFEPGVYYLPEGIKIRGTNITLDGNGALIVTDRKTGSGVDVDDSSNVTIKNFTIQGFYWGIVVNNSNSINILNCQISSTHELPSNTIFLDIWQPFTSAYGAGIMLMNVERGEINSNNLSHQQNGISLYQSSQIEVIDNIANYCSGWGFHLNEADHCLFENNYADYCCRYEPRGERRGHMGADSAGFLLVNRSCDNTFRRNFARMGGDGFFLAGMTPSNEYVGCNNNLIEQNDASYSPNNAFESTFNAGNMFINNIANFSNYGFWLGFSNDTLLSSNQIVGNRQAGVAVENGVNFTVQNNNISHNRHGLLLWSKRIREFEASLPDNDTSRDWLIENNTFTANHKAIRIAADQDHGVRELPNNGSLGFPAPKPHNHLIRNYKLELNTHSIEQVDVADTIIGDNELINNIYE